MSRFLEREQGRAIMAAIFTELSRSAEKSVRLA
jgi:hypothetical protein